MRDFQLAGRSPVHGTAAMMASTQPLATAAGLRMLMDGGNAVDAAITAAAVLAVIQPTSTGIGGDCLAMLYSARTGRLHAFNGSGKAPTAARTDWYRDRAIERIEIQSPHAVTVPGAVDAWAKLLTDHGTKSLHEVLQPAISLARDGYPVHARLAADWRKYTSHLSADPGSARLFLPMGRTPAMGERHVQAELAESLSTIAEQGRDAFYQGPIAARLVAFLRDLGGLHTEDDFATAAGDYVKPISFSYRGFDIHECPPSSQGLTALQIVNILSADDRPADPLGPERLHLLVEAAWIAYGERDKLLGDPAYSHIPVDDLLAPTYGRKMRERIHPDRASHTAMVTAPAHTDTVYLCTVDRDGNAVSLINSLFGGFGSGLTCPRTGILLHNRGAGFVIDPGHPNTIAPGKRPLHTIIPAMVMQNGRPVMPMGVLGGHYQPVGHAYLLGNLLEHGFDLQEAIDLARVFPVPDGRGLIEYETGIPAATRASLERMGHRLVPATAPIGGAQAIWIDHTMGVLTGASDGRYDGCALGF